MALIIDFEALGKKEQELVQKESAVSHNILQEMIVVYLHGDSGDSADGKMSLGFMTAKNTLEHLGVLTDVAEGAKE